MPGTRLLVVADPKMLPALANGLRGGGAFDVLTVPSGDVAAAQTAAERADAVAIFYGTPDRPLAAALQALAPPVRERGGRVLAVLQREQAGQRDECFRAGASDLFFMPMAKDQFVTRLSSAVRLSYPGDPGISAAVSVATRSATSVLAGATVTPSGVHAARALPFKPGETVRLSWDRFQVWGLVVQGVPAAQIRFAGLTLDEEAQIRDWLVGVAPAAAALATAAPATAAPATAAPATAVSARDSASSGEHVALHADGARSAPLAGPPPGFADRKPIRPQTARSARPPALPPTNGAAAAPGAVPAAVLGADPAAAVLHNGAALAGSARSAPGDTSPEGTLRAPVAAAPPSVASAAPAASGAAGPSVASSAAAAPPSASPPSASPPSSPPGAAFGDVLFAEPPPPAAAPSGPSWPMPTSAASCRRVAFQLLKDKSLPAEVSSEVAVAARKIVGLLGSTERAALDKAGPDSHLADALAARIALEVASSEGVRLYSSSPAAVVDAAGFAALHQLADAAGARLQKEASQAVGRGEVEQLQLVTAASAALSRDALNFKATADRLRGIGAAPRLGAGALDPNLIISGPAPRPLPSRTGEPAPVRAELRDFTALDNPGGGARARKIGIAVLALVFAGTLVNALFFALPRVTQMSAEKAGAGVERIDVAGKSANVTVQPAWVAAGAPELTKLLEVLRSRGVEKAMLTTSSGAPAGMLDVQEGKIYGLPKAGAAGPPKPAY